VTALLKQRLIGAIVLISLGIIFIPMLLTGKGELTKGELPTNIPPKPLYEIQAPSVLPLEDKASAEKTAEPISNSSVAKAIDDNLQQPAAQPKAESEQTNTVENESDKTVAKVSNTNTDQDRKGAEPVKAEALETETVPPTTAETKQVASKSNESSPSVKPQVSQVTQTPQVTKVPQVQEKVAIAPKKPPIVSGWIVQLGSFSKEKNAIKLRDSLRKNGHASFVESYERSGKTSYRVRVGPELTRELAEELKKQLKKETKLDGLVMSYPG